MAVEKAPYINYTEVTSYNEYIDNGSEIPLFVVKTDNNVNVADITPEKVLRFISYSAFKKQFNISDEEELYEKLDDSIKELDALVKDFFVENSMYGSNDNYGLAVPYIYMVDIGNNPTVNHYIKALKVSEAKRNSSVALFPNTEDVEFMNQVNIQLKEETKTGLLRIGYFAFSSQGEFGTCTVGNVILPQFNHHGFTNQVKGYLKTTDDTQDFYKTKEYKNADKLAKSTNIIYHEEETGKDYKYVNNSFVEVDVDSLDGYTEVIEVYKDPDTNKFYEDSVQSTEVTPNATVMYLNTRNDSHKDAYTWDGTKYVAINVLYKKDTLLYEDDNDYKFFIPSTKKEIGGSNETFDQYCERASYISRKVASSRIALVEKEHFGKTIARICSTPYYIEPGYLPYMSVPQGVFRELSGDDRDELFATGLIFNEDDYTLSAVTPRICLATSTAWGVEDHDVRTTDALIHARRNADHHVRRMLSIIAPQLKRNETSVNLRIIKNQLDEYLDSELSRGTIMEYAFDIVESSYNPYTLLIRGRITPVNSTLAIEFENTIGSPYAIASEYV